MMVKVCGITNPDDALAAVEAGATALGFNFYPRSPRYVAPEAVAAILARVPARVLKVGVFVDEPPEAVAAVAQTAGLDVVQIHGERGAPGGLRAWQALSVTSDGALPELDRYRAEAYLLDAFLPGSRGGTGRTWDWTLAAGLDRNIILAGGLDAGNVREAIRLARPWGVDACSRLEISPGRKDHARMTAFVQAALAEAA